MGNPVDNSLSEFDLISRFFAPLSEGCSGALGLTDDAALIDVPDHHQLVVTTDSLVAGVHFLPHDPPKSIASRALRSNLSDLAAMGAEPLVYTMAISLPTGIQAPWLESFTAHLRADQNRFGICLAGGDTVRTPGPLSITITAMGIVPQAGALRRNGAIPGDRLYVSGTIGDARLGLGLLRGDITMNNSAMNEPELEKYAMDRFHFPSPRLELGTRLRGRASACADISDGLVRDIANICRASGCRAIVNWEDIPLSSACQAALSQRLITPSQVLTGGDDYELVFTGPPGMESDDIMRIGVIEQCSPRQNPVEIQENGHIMETGEDDGYEHTW